MSSDWLDDSEWVQYATALKDGERTRVQHDCGEGESLLITKRGTEINAWCFRCGAKGYKVEHESIDAKLKRIAAESSADASVSATVELPSPREYDTKVWPQDAKVWFFKMGLSLRMIADLGLYWCPAIGRVVLPIMRGDRAVYWTARSARRAPKWLTPTIPKDGLVAKFGEGKGDTIVLCEDPLSAYKIGQVNECWSLLGTKLHPKVLQDLINSGKRIAVWLDDDVGRSNGKNPGQDSAAKILARLRAFGLQTRNITSPRDPKYYDLDYIKEKLYGEAHRSL